MNYPKISVIIPCYNQGHYLSEALQSVLNQTYENWECLIVNDGSQDNTHQVAQEWLEKDKRFSYIFKENGGLSSARNKGLDNATGEYIQFLDADDIIDIKKFEFSLLELKKIKNKKKCIVVSHFNFFINSIEQATSRYCNLSFELLNYKSILYNWDYEFSIPIHCGFLSTDLFQDFRFSTDLKAKEDWLMWLHMFKKDIEVYFINLPLAFYRTHPFSMTQNHKLMEENTIKVLKLFKTVLSIEEYDEYLVFLIQRKNFENEKLKSKLNKIQNSSGFKAIEKVKKNSIISFFFRLYGSIFKSKFK